MTCFASLEPGAPRIGFALSMNAHSVVIFPSYYLPALALLSPWIYTGMATRQVFVRVRAR